MKKDYISKDKKTLSSKVLMLTNQEWENFQKLLNAPKKPTKAMKDLMNLERF